MVVFFVDDSEADRAFYRAVLEANGFTVLLADAQPGVIETCRRKHPDIIVLDGMLQDTDGFSICRALRKHAEFRETPILILSGMDPEEAVNRAREAGADGFVPKAGNWKPLLSAIRSFANHAG